MTDKSQLVLKMNQPAGNGHHGASHSNVQGQQKIGRNEGRGGNQTGRGKDKPSVRGREKTVSAGESEAHGSQKPKNRRNNTKRGRLANEFVNFEYYQPQPRRNNYFKSCKGSTNYTKEDYVNVSCQFVVDESNQDVSTVIDSCVEWKDVIQVRLPCEELPSCPICLYPPVCPVTPACGHSMCYSCALRFQNNCPGGDCPICHKVLIMADFRPLKTYPRKKYSVGDEIAMKLVSRCRDGRIVSPINEGDGTDAIPNMSSEWGSKFCHAISATKEQVLYEVLLPQEDELKTQLALLDDDEKSEQPYILQALKEVSDKKNECYEKIEQDIKSKQLKDENKTNSSAINSKQVFFYQCADGQPIFIHPLNSRCLIHENGTIEACPPEICCKIIAMEFYTQSPESRLRYRYFSHLSLGCPFVLCEIEIHPFISDETYAHFKTDLEKRSKTRQVKEKKENAYSEQLSRKLAQKEVTYRSSAFIPRLTEVSKPDTDHFMTQESYDLLTNTSDATNDVPLTFAEKLIGQTKKHPTLKSKAALGAVEACRGRLNSTSSDVSHGSDSGTPSFQHSFSASINDAFASLDVADASVIDGNSGGRQGKKKKNKGKTISLTGGARRF